MFNDQINNEIRRLREHQKVEAVRPTLQIYNRSQSCNPRAPQRQFGCRLWHPARKGEVGHVDPQ
jgi:hypothetical protein